MCRNSACIISDLFAQHRRSFGINGIHTFQLNCLLTACSIHIINLPALSATKHLTDACNSFHDLVHLNAWATGSLNVIKDLVAKWQLILPMEVETALHRNGDLPLSDFNFTLPTTPSERYTSAGYDPTDTLKRASSNPALQEKQKRPRIGPRERSETSIPYLFAPFPNQPAPLLGPIHTSTSADTEWNDELNQVAREFDGLDFSADPYIGWPRGPEGDQDHMWE